MTSEIDGLETNEFLRRRKLRLQQVREQSKDIAKKLRQRAKVERSRQVIELDAVKQKEYLQQQEKLVQALQEFYAKGIKNVGASHRNAADIISQENRQDKLDPSKQRGKEAAAELRRKRQEILDEQKKKLDRKLLAREAANEISREKTVTVANKLGSKDFNKDTGDIQTEIELNKGSSSNVQKDSVTVTRADMATQWDKEEYTNDWDPEIPALSLPKDDKDSVKELNNNESKSDKSKRLDLFALSKEMPSSLRGRETNMEEHVPVKSSLTLVSEYLQNRGLRLRESDTTAESRKAEDLQSLKQTILRTRVSKQVSAKENTDKASKASSQSVSRKPSVTIYNHSTRDTRDIPINDDHLVIRNTNEEENAYSQAMKENTESDKQKAHENKMQSIRGKVAMTKQNVEKEYKDTMNFLNSMPKSKGSRPIKTAYMDEHRQQKQRETRQQKLQHEFRQIEKECRKHSCKNKPLLKSTRLPETQTDFNRTDFQYSWMPVPESDANLAIHTIPTSVKENKRGNTVKFSKVDSYHEYRSRHKHTPPTKDSHDRRRIVEVISGSDTDSPDSTSSTENIRLEREPVAKDAEKSDEERIIVYKILDSKVGTNSKTSKLMKTLAKSLTVIEKQNTDTDIAKKLNENIHTNKKSVGTSLKQVNEGIYKTVTEKSDGDNITSLYFREREDLEPNVELPSEGNSDRPCCCSKRLSKGDQEDKGTYVTKHHWETGDNISKSAPNTCTGCQCGELNKNVSEPKEQPYCAPAPSAATSTSSFQTATAVQAAGSKPGNAVPEVGYIKLVDDNGPHETGKFYIGASGFLKDDNYEVVIQLRKKGDEKEKDTKEPSSGKSERALHTIDEKSLNDKEKVSDDTQDKITIVQNTEIRTEPGPVGPTPNDLVPAKSGTTPEENTQSSTSITDSKDSKNVKSSEEIMLQPVTKVFVTEKGVGTSFQESFAIASDVPKLGVKSRVATSTYTQTSLSSPNPRPVLFHMSSSTSTAYMSPPEMIIPNFIKADNRTTEDEYFYPKNEKRQRIDFTEHEQFEDNVCRCKKCLRSRNSYSKRNHVKSRRSNTTTPPNTAEMRDTEYITQKNVRDKPKCIDRKCKCHHRLPGADNYNKPLNQTTKQSLKTTVASLSHKNNANLKPLLKNYVDKLLALNRESIKAVQVVDQECSTVDTPGSSIIEVASNTRHDSQILANKISLQQITTILKHKLLNSSPKPRTDSNHSIKHYTPKHFRGSHTKLSKLPRKKAVHKVKSLNVSKKICKSKHTGHEPPQHHSASSSSSSGKIVAQRLELHKVRSRSSPTPRSAPIATVEPKSANSDKTHSQHKLRQCVSKNPDVMGKPASNQNKKNDKEINTMTGPQFTSTSSNADVNIRPSDIPTSTSTQTSINADCDINFIKLAENKLQNMEKIADLTEKCTQRLSNLARVLEEVRKNKLVYSQVSSSDTTTDSDHKLDKDARKILTPQNEHESIIPCKPSAPESIAPTESMMSQPNDNILNSTEYVPFLTDIPKPANFFAKNSDVLVESSLCKSKLSSPSTPVRDEHGTKTRGKPPPALSRIHLKNAQEYVMPHELSTVIEVDSPMSLKLKSQSSRTDTRVDGPESSMKGDIRTYVSNVNNVSSSTTIPQEFNEITSYTDFPTSSENKIRNDSSNDSKVQMIDMKQFNEIMLKPFFSLQEYANHCNVAPLDDGSNLEDAVRKEPINDEISSMHSDGSLPDVISELLKRNIISEPFKFDTGSNVNSTTLSSESTVSVLALSKATKEKRKSNVIQHNKENIAETSDTMSISSNPDLENAFKKMGIGWASSTLKKTKERLALSSSSNTSSSSLSQFKIRSFNQPVPTIPTDDSSISNLAKQPQAPGQRKTEVSKHIEQQTSLTKSMTVKEFLANELAKKITFTNKSVNDTEDEFMSLFETNMPEEMKHSSRVVREESVEHSVRSGGRARTSTPVQLFKSMTYQSSSSSNLSNGLFSNADLSSVKVTSNSMKHSTSDKDDLIIPNFSLRIKRTSECSKSE